MRRWERVWALAALLASLATRDSLASGAWTTYIRPNTFADLIAEPESVWCATEEAGLVIYDRASGTFHSETREPGRLASNQLTSLAFDRSGTLWIGTADAGVSFETRFGRWGLINAFDGLPSLAVRTLRAQGDTVWIGTSQGLALYNGTEIAGRLPDGVNPSPFGNDDVSGIVVRGDSLWISTGDGVYYSTISTGLSMWNKPTAGFPTGAVNALATDGKDVWALANKRVWIALPGNSWGLLSGLGSVVHLADDFDEPMAASDSGIYRWDGASWATLNPNLMSGGTASLQFMPSSDPAGIAFAADFDGLFAQTGTLPWTQIIPPAPPGNDLQDVKVQGSRVYVTSNVNGVGRLDGNQWTIWGPQGCTTNCASSFFFPIFTFNFLIDDQGYKWLGSWGNSLDVMDDAGPTPLVQHLWVGNGSAIDVHTRIISGAADSSLGRWFGMDSPSLGCNCPDEPIGIDWYSPSGRFLGNFQPSKTDSAISMANTKVRSLAFDANRNLMWVGYATTGAQYFFVPGDTNSRILNFRTLDDAKHLDVFSVLPHSDSVWVLSSADLRLYVSPSDNSTGTAYPIPSTPAAIGAVHAMDVTRDGSVWIATSTGARVYHPGSASNFEDFTVANSPLAGVECRSVTVDPATGVVWIATEGGLNRYDPGYVAPPTPQIPQLVARVFPNPAWIAKITGAPVRVTGNTGTYSGKVYSVEGRLVRRLSPTFDGDVLWDGRDDDGALVRPGLYFVRLEGGGRTATARVTLLR